MKSLRASIAKVRHQLDRDLVSTIAVRLSSTVVSALTAILLVRYLSPQEQGFWYTFGSILGIAAFAEMGAGQILMRFVAREQGTLDKNPESNLRLRSLFRFGAKLGLGIATLTTLSAIPIGLWWLSNGERTEISWRSPWLLAAIASGPTIFLGFANAYFEGWQLVAAANLRRALSSWISLGTLIAAFVSGWGLFAFGISRIVSAIYGLSHIAVAHGSLVRRYQLTTPAPSNFEPKTEFWPLQLRYGMTWATGIFVSGLYAPLIFRFDGPVAAGQYGMSFSIVSIISGLAASLIGARQAKLAAMAGSADTFGMRKLLREILKLSTLAFGVGSIALLSILFWAPDWTLRYIERLLPLNSLLLLLSAQAFWLFITIYTTYVRSFNTEPFVKLAWCHAAFSVSFGIPAVILFNTPGILTIALLGNIGSSFVCWKIAREI